MPVRQRKEIQEVPWRGSMKKGPYPFFEADHVKKGYGPFFSG
jgi:hypothetical protein